MTFNKTLLSGLSALAIGLGASLGVANAQDDAAPAPQMEAPAAAPAPAMDDEKLKSFAVAFLEVTKVTQSYQPQMEGASPEDQQRLQQEAGEKMVEAVSEADGISVDEYNMIIQAAQTDPDLAQRINGHITAAAGETQPALAQ